MALVGKERAGNGIAWGHVDRLFSAVLDDWKKDLYTKTLPLPKFWPGWVNAWNQGTNSLLAWNRPEEVLAMLSKSKAGRGDLAARILLLGVRGGTPQPLGDAGPEVIPLVALDLKNSIEFAEKIFPGKLLLAKEAAKLWVPIYSELRELRYAGTMIDIMTELAERHVLRLAGLYAVVDQSPEIKPEHLLAALAIWDHHEETLRELFGHQTGNKKQDAILRALRERHPTGLTTGEINSTVLQGNSRGGAEPILKELEHAGLIYSQEEPANGRGKRPAYRWFTTQTPDVGMKHSYLGIAKAIMRKTVDPSPEGGGQFRAMKEPTCDEDRRTTTAPFPRRSGTRTPGDDGPAQPGGVQ